MTTKALKFKTLVEALIGEKPQVDHFKVFGCLAYVYIDSQEWVKFDSKSRAGIFIGYNDQSRAYKVIDSNSLHVHINRNIGFCKEKAWDWSGKADLDTSNCEPARELGMTQANDCPVQSTPFDQINERPDDHPLNNSSSSNKISLAGEDGGTRTRYRKLVDIYNSCSLALSMETLYLMKIQQQVRKKRLMQSIKIRHGVWLLYQKKRKKLA